VTPAVKNDEPVASTSDDAEASEPAKDDSAAEETAPDKTMTLPEFADGDTSDESDEDTDTETDTAERPKPSPGRPVPQPSNGGRPVRSAGPSTRKR
jgi:hypothetical protein